MNSPYETTKNGSLTCPLLRDMDTKDLRQRYSGSLILVQDIREEGRRRIIPQFVFEVEDSTLMFRKIYGEPVWHLGNCLNLQGFWRFVDVRRLPSGWYTTRTGGVYHLAISQKKQYSRGITNENHILRRYGRAEKRYPYDVLIDIYMNNTHRLSREAIPITPIYKQIEEVGENAILSGEFALLPYKAELTKAMVVFRTETIGYITTKNQLVCAKENFRWELEQLFPLATTIHSARGRYTPQVYIPEVSNNVG